MLSDLSDDARLIVVVLALALAGVVAFLVAEHGGVLKLSTGLDIATDQAGWMPDTLGPKSAHLCQPVHMPHRLHARHPLFHRPAHLGSDRVTVSQNGWGWFADPPEAEVL
ncbi:MAG: hypothetical protein ACYCO9_16445 [Streptosporangiaceae bacterium]